MTHHALSTSPDIDPIAERYLNPLPRSVARLGESLLLDGAWNFELDLDNRGLAEHWEQGHVYTKTAQWPGSIESHLEAGAAQPWTDEVVAWYERTFDFPEHWAGELVQISFGAVSYETRVWLNGSLLKTVEGEEVHYGEYSSFSYEVPAELLQPINRVTVRIADSLDDETLCGKQASHIYKRGGIDPRMYDLADELGMLLWVEIPSPHSSTPTSRENHWTELLRMQRVIISHPSVVIWSMYNEDWGIQDIATSQEAQAYIIRCREYIKLYCPQVLMVDNDGWRHVSRNGVLQSDLLTAHIYQNTLEYWERALDRICAGDITVTAEALVVGDPYFYEGQMPLVVSEWGGFGFDMYGGPALLTAREEQIRLYKQALRARPIAGDVYTQATNVEDERNGLLDFQTGELFVPEGVLRSTSHADQQSETRRIKET